VFSCGHTEWVDIEEIVYHSTYGRERRSKIYQQYQGFKFLEWFAA